MEGDKGLESVKKRSNFPSLIEKVRDEWDEMILFPPFPPQWIPFSLFTSTIPLFLVNNQVVHLSHLTPFPCHSTLVHLSPPFQFPSPSKHSLSSHYLAVTLNGIVDELEQTTKVELVNCFFQINLMFFRFRIQEHVHSDSILFSKISSQSHLLKKHYNVQHLFIIANSIS